MAPRVAVEVGKLEATTTPTLARLLGSGGKRREILDGAKMGSGSGNGEG